MSRVLICLLLGSMCYADGESADADEMSINDRQELIVSGFLASASCLRQGVYEVSGDVKHFAADGTQTFQGTVSIFSAFDFDSDKLRFDRSETALDEILRKEGAETLIETAEILAGGKMISLSDRSVVWLQSPKGRPIVTESPTKQHGVIRPTDPRVYGVAGWDEVYRTPWERVEPLLRVPATAITDGEDGQVTLVWQLRAGGETPIGPTVLRQITFDAANGYCPVHFKCANGLNSDGTWRRITALSSVTWKSQSDAWVPDTVTMERRASSGSQTVNMKFTWRSINDSADAAGNFDPAAFDLPVTLSHIDTRLGGTPILLGPSGSVPAIPEGRIDPETGWRGGALVAVNIFAVLLIFLFVVFRSRNRVT